MFHRKALHPKGGVQRQGSKQGRNCFFHVANPMVGRFGARQAVARPGRPLDPAGQGRPPLWLNLGPGAKRCLQNRVAKGREVGTARPLFGFHVWNDFLGDAQAIAGLGHGDVILGL